MSDYKRVYFRLDSNYKWGSGWDFAERNEFDDDILRLFSDSPYKIIVLLDSMYIVNKTNNTKLYIHPMDISGVCAIEDIEPIENILKQGSTFKYITTDIYEDLVVMDDYEYTRYLYSKIDDIKADILDLCRTKRKNLFCKFHWSDSRCEILFAKYQVKRTCDYIGRSSNGVFERFIMDTFWELVDNGLIECAENKYGNAVYRTV